MPSRKWHTKTRHACQQCKKRRMRCSLTRPVCSGCLKRETLCDFSLDESAAVVGQVEQAPHQTISQHYPLAAASVPPSHSITAHHLIHPSSFLPKMDVVMPPTHPGMLLRFSEQSPELAVEDPIIEVLMENVRIHDFLQYSFRALTTLYEARGKPLLHQQRMLVLGDHIKASELFRKSSIDRGGGGNSQSWVAVLAFSMSVVIFQLRMAATTAPGGNDTALEVLTALRFAAQLARSAAPSFVKLREREVQQKSPPRHDTGDGVVADPKMTLCFQMIEQRLDDGTCSALTANIVREALRNLKHWLAEVQGFPQTWMHLAKWPAMVSQEYIDLTALGDPIAMALLVPWSIVISQGPPSCHSSGWPALLQGQALVQMEAGLSTAIASLFWPELGEFAASRPLIASPQVTV